MSKYSMNDSELQELEQLMMLVPNFSPWGNAIFVGYDENGIPRHAHKRGLYTEGKGYIDNLFFDFVSHCMGAL